MRWRGLAVGAVLAAAVLAWPAGAPAAQRTCALPAGAHDPQRAEPAAVDLDPAKVRDAVAFASRRLRINVQVFRNNCLVAEGPYNRLTGDTPWQLFSATKSIVSMLAGIAYTQGRLDLDAPIGTYLPAGLGDDAHRAITVRDLLTQSSGLKQSIVSEAGTQLLLGGDRDIVGQALALPFLYDHGTTFQYSQRGPDLLAGVVEAAVGEPLQRFAQRELFTPLGIRRGDYYWARDRRGNTYGYAFMFLPPNDFSRLGLLMLNDGVWRGRRIIGHDYVAQASTSSATNGCYGFLFWVNRGPCTGPTFPSRITIPQAPLPAMPGDLYMMVGFLQQNDFIIPSLGLMVSWNGVFGDVSPDPSTVLSASLNSELYHEFFRRLAPAFRDVDLPDAGPYEPTFNLALDWDGFAAPDVFLGALGLGPDAPPDCGPVYCRGKLLKRPFSDAPPGCFLIACFPVSPETPRRRPPAAPAASRA